MKNIFIITLSMFVFLTSSYVWGQNPNPEKRREQYETQKVAFISKNVNFTIKEAQLFWPYYNELQEKKAEIQKNLRQIIKKIELKNGEIQNKELEKLSDELIDQRVKEVQLEKIYHVKFKSVLPIKKVLKFYRAEVQFKTFFVRQMRNHNRPTNQSKR
ncbi:MAG: hypothetical protein ABFS35_06500 [Bacteroidota bacterium]